MQPRRRARILSRIALGLATLAAAGLFNAAHATFPGENGVIVFDSRSSDGSHYVIKKVSPGNSAVTILASGIVPSVSPNGKKVAFLSSSNVYVMNIDGSNVVQLTNDNSSFSPAWLPDGSQVAWERYVDGSNMQVELWTGKPDGTGNTYVRRLGVGYFPGFLAWSPQPTANGVNFFTVATMNAGLGLANDANSTITTLATVGLNSSWSPDGQSVLYQDQQNQQFEINWITGDLRSVPSPGAFGTSAISPDGAFIAGGGFGQQLITRARAGTPTTYSWTDPVSHKADWSRVPKNCYASTPQGGGGALPGDVDAYNDQCAGVVMPDGGKNGSLQQVLVIGSDGRVYHRVLKPGAPGVAPTWTNLARVPGAAGNLNGISAKKIAIAAAKDGSAQVAIVNAADNLVYHAMRYADGSWSGFTPLDGFAGAANFAARDVAITINASSATSPGNAQVIANGIDLGSVFYRVRWVDGTWSPFQQVPGADGLNTHELAIAAAEDGNTNVVATVTASNGSFPRIMQALRLPNSNWGAWVTVGIPSDLTLSASTDVAVTRTSYNTAQLLFSDAGGNTYFQERTSPNLAESWQLRVARTPIINNGRTVSVSAGPDAKSLFVVTRASPQ